MRFELIILKAAAQDAAEAFDYYETAQTGLCDRFLAELLERFNEISKHPKYYGFIDKQKLIRDVKLKNFPNLVVYEIEGESVIIYSVHSGYRNPDKKVPK